MEKAVESKKKFKPSLKAGYWPVIDSPQAARWAVKQGFAAAVFCAVATATLAVWSHYSPEMAASSGINLFALVDAAVFLIIAVGIFHNSRVAALAGLSIYLLERALMIGNTPPHSWIMVAIITVCYINGVRGAFALSSGISHYISDDTHYSLIDREDFFGRKNRFDRSMRPIKFIGAAFFLCLFLPSLILLLGLLHSAPKQILVTVAVGFVLVSLGLSSIVASSATRTRLQQFGLVCPSCDRRLDYLTITLKTGLCAHCFSRVFKGHNDPETSDVL